MATKSSTLEVDRTINAAQRTLSILNAFLTRDGPLTLGDLESETGLFKSVILRYMLSLEPDYVTRRQDGLYQLGRESINWDVVMKTILISASM